MLNPTQTMAPHIHQARRRSKHMQSLSGPFGAVNGIGNPFKRHASSVDHGVGNTG